MTRHKVTAIVSMLGVIALLPVAAYAVAGLVTAQRPPVLEPKVVTVPPPVYSPAAPPPLAPPPVRQLVSVPLVRNGLHVLCPLPQGGAAHLLLTAQTYYKAANTQEVTRLTQLYGPPVTSVDPSQLPPKSSLSVTEALGWGETSVFFVEPRDGAIVTGPLHVAMGAAGVEIEPAGADREGAGHFHISVDAGCVTPGEPIPSGPQRWHYGTGQRAADLDLSPGQHTLCLQLGDGDHTALPITHTISVTIR